MVSFFIEQRTQGKRTNLKKQVDGVKFVSQRNLIGSSSLNRLSLE